MIMVERLNLKVLSESNISASPIEAIDYDFFRANIMDNKIALPWGIKGHRTELPTLSLLSSMIILTLIPITTTANETTGESPFSITTFDTDFLKNTPGANIDISRFERGVPLLPGEYRPDLYINDVYISRENVIIRQQDDLSRICIQPTLLAHAGIKPDAINQENLARLNEPDTCVTVEQLIPSAQTSFDTGDMRLNIQLPQASLQRRARGSVDPSLWDAGENAFFVGYNTNFYQSKTASMESQSFYGALNAGYNLQGWMLRHSGSLRWKNDSKRRYDALRTYVQRDITPLEAMLVMGESNTSGELFDTFSFRGVQLATDERMLPDTQRGYAPVIRGIATTTAHVTISQNGSQLYDTTVPPGEFVIEDLYPTGYGGDLLVTVEESNGQTTSFSVPYASVAQLLRPGTTRYSAVAGTLQDFNLSYTPKVFQSTVQHGIKNGLTGYGGLLSTGEYNAALLGMAVGTPLGALALDVTGARASSHGRQSRGSSYRVTYSKLYIPTNSNLSIAAYRFSSSGYLDLSNAMLFTEDARHPHRDNIKLQRPRNRLSLTASQGLPEGWGQFYISGYSQNYWDREGHDNQYQAGYTNSLGRLSYNVSANRVGNAFGRQETQYVLSLSVPLGTHQQAPNLNLYSTHAKEGVSTQASVSGLLGENNQLSYNVGASRDANNEYSSNVSSMYRTPYASLQGSVARSKDYQSLSLGASGSVVALSDSITASPYTATTMAIVSAPNAGGAKVEGYSGIVLNNSGNAVVPYLSPYRMNYIALNPEGLSADVELESTSQRVAPRAGAVVKLHYPTSSGRAALIRAVMLDGKALPFGAPVTDQSGQVIGTVTQGGQIYARMSSNSDRLQVKWGKDEQHRCSFTVTLPDRDKKQTTNLYFDRVESQCDALN